MSNKKNAKKEGGVDIAKMTKEQLEVYAAKLQEEMEREREERNFFQIERDKIQTFWDISRQQLQESRSTNRVLRKGAQDFAKKLVDESVLARKKLSHLVHSYQTEEANINIEHLVALKKYQNHFIQQKLDIFNNHNKSMRIESEANAANLEQNHQLKLAQSKSLERIKEGFKQNCTEIQNKYDGKLMAYHKQFSLMHNIEIAEVEERKNEHVNKLIKEHEVAYDELKSFYNNILLNNLSVIENLKKKFSLIKKNELKMMGQFKDKN